MHVSEKDAREMEGEGGGGLNTFGLFLKVNPD